MTRILLLVLALAAFPAAADLESWAEKLGDKMMKSWEKDALETLLKGDDPRERAEAAERFGGRKEANIIAALGAALSDRDAKVRLAAASALWKSEKAAEPAKPELVKALNDADPNVVARAAGALQAIGMSEAELAAPRKRVLESAEASTSSRFLVARNLVGYEAPTKLVGPMLAYLENAARGYTGSVTDKQRNNVELVDQALEHLVKRTKDRSLIAPMVNELGTARGGAIVIVKALGFFDPKPDRWAETLVALCDSDMPRVRYAALGELRNLTKEKDVRVWAPRAAALVSDPDSSVRSNALWALGSAAGLAAGEIDKVVAAMGDPEASVRRSAARAIGEMGEANQAVPAASKTRVASAARPALTAAMEKDSDSDVRSEAKSALGKLEGRGISAGATVAIASPKASASGGSESGGMAVLRAKKVKFDDGSYYRALMEVDVEVVRAFLDAGMSPSAPLKEMGPPMRVMLFHSKACNPGERPTKPETKEIVKMLLERGADINGADERGNTSLMEAASKGCDRDLIKTMIKAGAKINAVNASGLTPFEMGLWMGHDGLEEIIAAGYRLPPDKVKMYSEGYKDRPQALAMVKKAAKK